MHVAAQADQAAFLVYLRSKGVSFVCLDKWFYTPLHRACYSGAEITMSYLCSWCKNLNRKDCYGYTPLHYAVWSALTTGNTRLLKNLLLKGANRLSQVILHII